MMRFAKDYLQARRDPPWARAAWHHAPAGGFVGPPACMEVQLRARSPPRKPKPAPQVRAPQCTPAHAELEVGVRARVGIAAAAAAVPAQLRCRNLDFPLPRPRAGCLAVPWLACMCAKPHTAAEARGVWIRARPIRAFEIRQGPSYPQAWRLERQPAPKAHRKPQGTPDRSTRIRFIRRASRTRSRGASIY